VWRFNTPSAPSRRQNVTWGVYVSDRVSLLDGVQFDAGLRFESASGQADGSLDRVAWRKWLPRARVRWDVSDRGQVATFVGYARSIHRLALDYLAVGDPGAPTADVFRGAPELNSPLRGLAGAVLVARAGPGTAGDPGFSAIAEGLKPPTVDELVIGMQLRPAPGLLVRLTGVARRERDLLGVTNIGVSPVTGYSTFLVEDPGGDLLGPEDDQLLSIYNRLPASFGKDRYLLVNPPAPDATFEGIELTIQLNTRPLLVTGGATAGQAKGHAASRGFGPLENDETVLGDLFSDPNAATLARGRLFTDRAYTAKFATVWRLPAGVRLGAVARYQDGQAFARMLIFPTLNQGAEAVRAFSNGESRFMFIGTLDARIQKAFALGGSRVTALLDAYNLLNLSNSVEEDVAAPPDVRIPTAVQPPRAIHVGLRFTF
jgi:hypothetical protein